MSAPAVLTVADASQVGQGRRAATRMAELAGFSEEKRGRVAIIATELGNNLVKYGQAGKLILQPIERGGRVVIHITAIDSGPGIADLQRCLQDGVSTGNTPGTGLGAVSRLADVFDIHSVVGGGTVVFAACAKNTRKAAEHSSFEWSVLSTPAPGETVCGDAWAVREHDGTLQVLVVDGLGHGILAAEAAAHATVAFDERPMSSPAEFCDRAHQAMRGSRGAALAVAAIAESGHVNYAGVGNIAGTIVAEGRGRGLASQNGTVGLHVRRVRETEYDLPVKGVLVLHSDGLTNRWALEGYPGLAMRHPAVIAAVLHRDCLRGRDDATVLVIKRGTRR